MPNDQTAAYLKEISVYHVLSFEEEQEIAKRIAKGDKEARKQLILHNLRLVVSIARTYSSNTLSFMELIEEGNLGLLRAVERFDPDKGVKFSTYGTHWIKQAINRAIRESAFTIRIPSYVIELIGKWKKHQEDTRRKLNREPSAHEITQALNMPREKIALIKRILNQRIIHNIQENQENQSITDVFTKESYEGTPDENSFSLSENDVLNRLLNSITDREAEILRWRYGLEEGEPKSYKEIAAIMHISRERVRQLEKESIRKLQEIAGS